MTADTLIPGWREELSERAKPRATIAALQEEVAALKEMLACALDEYEVMNGQIADQNDPHWSVTARAALGGSDA